MIFSLDVRRARKGDCLLCTYGTKEEPGLVMIDGGPKVSTGRISSRGSRKSERPRVGRRPLPVDLLMVSHVDDDHIQGILDLTGGAASRPRMPRRGCLKVLSFWHNSFDEIIGHEPRS